MTQMIGAWDSTGVLRPYDKLKVHQDGLKHPAISVFIVTETEILIQRRALNKYHTPGLWANTVCTHPHWNKTMMNCAIRRLSEELNIIGVELLFQSTIEYRADVGNGLIEHEVVSIFVAKDPEHKKLTFHHNLEEVLETRWVSYDNLLNEMESQPKTFTPWFKIYM